MKKIMVVDDELDQILTVKFILEKSGEDYEVISAKSGKECLKILETIVPDLILLDIMMPEMSGWQLYEKLKRNKIWENIPTVFLTARTDETAEKAGRFLGDGYIEKPFDSEDFRIKIKQFLKD